MSSTQFKFAIDFMYGSRFACRKNTMKAIAFFNIRNKFISSSQIMDNLPDKYDACYKFCHD